MGRLQRITTSCAVLPLHPPIASMQGQARGRLHTPIAALVLFIGSSACIASERELTLVPTFNQYVEYQKGVPKVYSNSPNTWVSLSVELESKKEAELWIGVGNRQAVPITVSGEGVIATSNEKPLQMLGAAELKKKAKRKAMWENIALGAAAGVNSYTASQQGRTTSTSTHSGTITNSYGGSTNLEYRGTTTTRTTDPGARQRAQEDANSKSADMIAGAKVSQQARTAVIEDYVFQKQTIQPDDVYAGFLQLELPKAIRSQSIPIEISIVAGVDTHRFFLFLDAPPTQEQTDTIRSIGARLVTANDQPESNDPKGAWRDRTRQYFVKWCIRNESKQMEALEHRNQDFEPFCQCLQGRIESVASSDEFKSTLNAKTDDERDALPYFFDVVDAFDNCQAQFNIPD